MGEGSQKKRGWGWGWLITAEVLLLLLLLLPYLPEALLEGVEVRGHGGREDPVLCCFGGKGL